MASIDIEALNGLTAAVSSLFPAPARAELATGVLVSAARVTPTGVGGYTGPSTGPAGDILGRRVNAELLLTVRADNGAELDGAVGQLTAAVLGAERRTLLEKGIQRIALGGIRDRVLPAAGETDVPVTRDVGVSVVYEYLKVPEEPTGIIQIVPVATAPGGGPLLRWEFDADPLERFDVVDDPAAGGGPSEWVWDAGAGRLEQRSGIEGGANNLPADRPGTYAVLHALPEAAGVTGYTLEAWLGSDTPGGIGVVFGWQSAASFAFYLMDSARGERVAAVKAGGVFRPLAQPARRTGAGFEPGRAYHLRVAVGDGRVEVFLDGERVLAGRDPALRTSGRVGLMARGCAGAFFHGVALATV